MSTRFSTILFIIFLFVTKTVHGQSNLNFGFEKKYDVPVFDTPGFIIPDAWAGGLNACQFGVIDLDFDEVDDLVVFDRHGNRTLTYRNLNIAGTVNYELAPELAENLPHFDDWVIFADYNMDGMNDIFAYSKGYAGIQVYKNKSADGFERVVYPYLKSFQGNGYVNILVTYADYPAIYDIDKDGDLDILSFWGLGSFIEVHQNQSIEKYGSPDSLDFRKTETCWGRFAESDESNTIYLDTCFERDQLTSFQKDEIYFQKHRDDPKHTGSTFLIFDENGDGLDDLLLGDVDFGKPALLINGGTNTEAIMASYTFDYPAYSTVIDLLSFPVMSMTDLDNDGKKDLVVSTFDPSLVKCLNYNSIWYYKNTGETSHPVFELKTKSFLQDEMLDFGAGAVPVFFDYNNDGFQDLVVGNFGYFDSAYYGTGANLFCNYRAQLALLENTGTSIMPQYRLIDLDFESISAYFPQDDPLSAACPTFGDLDGDGDADMLVGNAKGTLVYFENIADPGNAADFIMTDMAYQGIDVGDFSAPQLTDLTGDGLIDLAIGKINGTISFFENTGSVSQPVFTLVTDSLGGVDVRDPGLSVYGYCVPHFFKDKDGKIHLFAGSEFGDIYYYTGIENNINGTFKLVMKNFLWINEGLRSAVAISNLDGDLYPDMIVGNYSGGLSYFRGTAAPPAGTVNKQPVTDQMLIFPNPAKELVNIDFNSANINRILFVRIFSGNGNIVYEMMNLSQFPARINIANWDNGLYFVSVCSESANKLITTSGSKFIVAK